MIDEEGNSRVISANWMGLCWRSLKLGRTALLRVKMQIKIHNKCGKEAISWRLEVKFFPVLNDVGQLTQAWDGNSAIVHSILVNC